LIRSTYKSSNPGIELDALTESERPCGHIWTFCDIQGFVPFDI
jgi:hypothetical protein